MPLTRLTDQFTILLRNLPEVNGARRRSVAAVGRLRRLLGTHGNRIVFLTGPGSRKARNLRRDSWMALSIAPVNDPFVFTELIAASDVMTGETLMAQGLDS
jgi:hypothetical protein